MKRYIFSNLLPQTSGSEERRDDSRHGTHHGGRQPDAVQLQADRRSETVGHPKGDVSRGRSTVALLANRMLDKMRVRINKHYQEIMEVGKSGKTRKRRKCLTGTPLPHADAVFRQHNEDYEKQVEAGMKAQRYTGKVPYRLQAPARVP